MLVKQLYKFFFQAYQKTFIFKNYVVLSKLKYYDTTHSIFILISYSLIRSYFSIHTNHRNY